MSDYRNPESRSIAPVRRAEMRSGSPNFRSAPDGLRQRHDEALAKIVGRASLAGQTAQTMLHLERVVRTMSDDFYAEGEADLQRKRTPNHQMLYETGWYNSVDRVQRGLNALIDGAWEDVTDQALRADMNPPKRNGLERLLGLPPANSWE